MQCNRIVNPSRIAPAVLSSGFKAFHGVQKNLELHSEKCDMKTECFFGLIFGYSDQEYLLIAYDGKVNTMQLTITLPDILPNERVSQIIRWL